MNLFTLLALLTLVFQVAPTLASDEIQTLKDLKNLYRPEAMAKYGKPIQISIENSAKMNAYAFARFGSPQLTISSGALKQLHDDEVISTICHEIGHLFGVRHKWTVSGLAIEGEADYFAGSCIVRFLRQVRGMSPDRAEREAIEIAEHEAVAFARSRLNWEKAYLEAHGGIKRGYPNRECRLLTVIHGIKGWKRPQCWYNPQN